MKKRGLNRQLYTIWKKLIGFQYPFYIVSVILMLAFSAFSAKELFHYIKIAMQEPVPIQSITGTEEFESFVYIEAQDVSDWYYLRSGKRSNRTNARYYYVATDIYSNEFVIECSSRISQELLDKVSIRNRLRIEGMTASLDDYVISGLAKSNPQGFSEKDIIENYSGILLTEEKPSGHAKVILGTEILFWIGLISFGISLCRGFWVSVKCAKKNGTIEFVLSDWKAISYQFKPCAVYLGERFVFLQSSGTFFEYTEIVHLEQNTKYPTIMAVAHLKDGRKVEVGTCLKAEGREKIKAELMAAISQRMEHNRTNS